MRYIGIDYGTKKVGVALTDGDANMAFPHSVILNDPELFTSVLALTKAYSATVVMGDSRANDGTENPVAKEARAFGDELAKHGVVVVYEPEYYTSKEAERIQGRTEMQDASAATLILNSYLKRNHTTS